MRLRSFARPGFPFVDVHMALLAAAAGDRKRSRARRRADGAGRGGNPRRRAGGARDLPRAALAFAEEDHAACVRHLEPVAAEAVRIGGSGAQRELGEDMLLLALMRSGEAAKAGALLDRRLHRRPSPRDTRWHALLSA